MKITHYGAGSAGFLASGFVEDVNRNGGEQHFLSDKPHPAIRVCPHRGREMQESSKKKGRIKFIRMP
jgi:hypothetical protein